MIIHTRSPAGPPSRLVVLGASGFVGHSLVARAGVRGVDAVAFGSADADLSDPRSVDVLADLIRADDTVVMASAITPDKGRDTGAFMQNVAMADHLARALKQSPCDHLVYISSDAVYPDIEGLLDESSCTGAPTLYGIMHRAREVILEAAVSNYAAFVAVRPVAVTGPGDTHNSYGPNRFCRSAVGDRKIALFGRGEDRRDHLFISDLIDILEMVLDRRSTGVLNAASGEAVAFGDVAAAVAAMAGGDVRIENLAQGSPVTHRHFDTTALIRAFPSFRPTPLNDAIRRTLHGLEKSPT